MTSRASFCSRRNEWNGSMDDQSMGFGVATPRLSQNAFMLPKNAFHMYIPGVTKSKDEEMEYEVDSEFCLVVEKYMPPVYMVNLCEA
ncbi:hypothetical protein E2542_SST22347 [Spatholobus suberectus]|nr:hypothetical protein E2542_SST22347 [Spatholobus suberectus]